MPQAETLAQAETRNTGKPKTGKLGILGVPRAAARPAG
jgi:hypothetical protein